MFRSLFRVGKERFISTVSSGNVENVKKMLDRDIDPSFYDSETLTWASMAGRSMLELIATAGKYEISHHEGSFRYAVAKAPLESVQYFLQCGPNPAHIVDVLKLAKKYNRWSVFALILEAGPLDDERNIMQVAINAGEEYVSRILARGIRVVEADFLFAVEANKMNIVELLLDSGFEYNPDGSALETAVKNNHIFMAQRLIEIGTSQNCIDAALLVAVIHKRVETLRVLLINGGRISTYGDLLILTAFNMGYSSLPIKISIIDILLEFGANVHAGDNYMICKASASPYPEILACLIKHNANVRARNDEPLRNAVSAKCVKNVEHLLLHGAGPNAQNDNLLLDSIRDVVWGSSSKNIPDLLLAHGADINALDGSILAAAINFYGDLLVKNIERVDMGRYREMMLSIAKHTNKTMYNFIECYRPITSKPAGGEDCPITLAPIGPGKYSQCKESEKHQWTFSEKIVKCPFCRNGDFETFINP